ncbi:hypothetical protein NPIL_275811 [Nephila pilipes]|uniref:Uncharacterized protein n=1 Tax=Nephila pilipes TaxID=299642 RepID=A0A8X6QHW5_NEPPI|nr:hypothetical protein NPIL_275811 [Nephila pilipes]
MAGIPLQNSHIGRQTLPTLIKHSLGSAKHHESPTRANMSHSSHVPRVGLLYQGSLAGSLCHAFRLLARRTTIHLGVAAESLPGVVRTP